MPPKLTVEEKRRRREVKIQKKSEEIIDKDKIPLLRDSLEKSISNLREVENFETDNSKEFFRDEWEDEISNNMKAVLNYIENNETNMENINKRVTNILENEVATIQEDTKNLKELIELEAEKFNTNLTNNLRHQKSVILQDIKESEDRITQLINKETAKIKNSIEIAIQRQILTIEKRITKEIEGFYSEVIVKELEVRDKSIEETYIDVLKTQKNLLDEMEEKNKNYDREIEKLKEYINNLQQNLLACERKCERYKNQAEEIKHEMNELESRSKYTLTLVENNELRIKEMKTNLDTNSSHKQVTIDDTVIRESPNTSRSINATYNVDSVRGSSTQIQQQTLHWQQQQTTPTLNDDSRRSISLQKSNVQLATQSRIKLKIPVFKNNQQESPIDFLERMKNYVEANNLNMIEIKCILSDSLMYSAGSWWRLVKNEIKTFEEFEKEFKNRFWSRNVISEINRTINYGRYNPKGKKNRMEYATDLYLKAKETESFVEIELVEILSKHFSPDVEISINQSGNKNFRELLKILEIKDKYYFKPQQSNNNGNEKDKSQEDRERGGLSNSESTQKASQLNGQNQNNNRNNYNEQQYNRQNQNNGQRSQGYNNNNNRGYNNNQRPQNQNGNNRNRNNERNINEIVLNNDGNEIEEDNNSDQGN